MALTAAAVPIWMHLSLMEECRGHVERALATFDAGLIYDAHREMKLHAARAVLLPYIQSDISEIGVASAKALQLAEMLGNFEYQLRSLWSQWYFHSTNGRYRVALARARRFSTIAANQADATDQLVGEILVGVSLHYLGDQPGARGHIGHALEHAPLQRSQIVRFLVEPRVFAGAYLSRILWLQGFRSRQCAQPKGASTMLAQPTTPYRCATPWLGGMPDCAVGRRSGQGRTLHRHSARSFEKVFASCLARLRPKL